MLQEGIPHQYNLTNHHCVGLCVNKERTKSSIFPQKYGVHSIDGVGGPWGFNGTCEAFSKACNDACYSEKLIDEHSKYPPASYCMASPHPLFQNFASCACSPYMSPPSWAIKPGFNVVYMGRNETNASSLMPAKFSTLNHTTSPTAIPKTYQTLEHLSLACAHERGQIRLWTYTPYPFPDLAVCVTAGVPETIIPIPGAIPTWYGLGESGQQTCAQFESACDAACDDSATIPAQNQTKSAMRHLKTRAINYKPQVYDSSKSTQANLQINSKKPVFQQLRTHNTLEDHDEDLLAFQSLKYSNSYSVCTATRKDGTVRPFGQCICINKSIPQLPPAQFKKSGVQDEFWGTNVGDMIDIDYILEKDRWFLTNDGVASVYANHGLMVSVFVLVWVFF